VLEHVRWIGGGSGAGKSTVGAHLAHNFGLQLYSSDDTIRSHGSDPGQDAPLMAQFAALTMDERWLLRDAGTMLRTFPWFAGERFERLVSDLAALPILPTTLAEGFRLLPRLVFPLVATARHAVWLIPTIEFRESAFRGRDETAQFWLGTSDPPAALLRLQERDRLFTEAVLREADELGLKTIPIDGRRAVADVADEITDWFMLE
jgi:hypothetical protein